MSRVKLLAGLAVVVGAVAVLLGASFFDRAEDRALPEPALINRTHTGLGITYIPITRGLSEYYGLGVDSGVLVTEVAPDSPADRAGVQAGDVIVSFNGTRLGQRVPLLGMMMDCPPGDTAMLEVRRKTEVMMVKFFHEAR